MKIITCRPKSLTPEQTQLAAQRSIEINPANAAEMRTIERTPLGRRGGPRRLTLLVGNRWPQTTEKITVRFLDNASKELKRLILGHMNAWSDFCRIRFVESSMDAMVRIARLDTPVEMAGYWSYVGTQILGINDKNEPTMNLEGFTARTSEAEFRRVVRHETGHTLGFEHEHMRSELVKKIDRKKAFVYFDRTQGWSKQETLQQVLTPLAKRSIMGTTEADPVSIMCYEIPGEITMDGKPIIGGVDINENDRAFAAKVYPKKDRRRTETPGDKVPGEPPPVPPIDSNNSVLNREADEDTFHIVVMDGFNSDGSEPSAAESPRFARVFASYAGARVTASMRLKAASDEHPTAFGRIIRTHERIKNYTNRDQGSLPSDEEMIEFGSDLFEALFQGDVRRLYDEARARQQNRKLDIVLTSMIPWIAEKPWEFAYDAGRQCFLATEEVHLIRNVVTAMPANFIPARSGPLRILVVAAQLVSFGQLSIEQEIEVVRRGFEPLVDEGLVEVEVLPRATPRRIQCCLSTGNFDVVHVIGHSAFDEAEEEGVVFFEDDRGGEFRLGERSAREIFCKRGVSLVFLNSCESGSGGRHHFNRGIAQALVSHGMPAVVANQYSVLDSSATSFAQHFYWAIGNGMSVGKAACEARIAVNCSLQGEIIDWAVPVVYVRDPSMTICSKPAKPAHSVGPVRAMARTAVQEKPVRIAVWDIDNVLPALSTTLERMNQVQPTFGFELAALSVPVDAWDLEARAEDGTPYLRADRLAKRLKDMSVEMRVNLLACVTRHWMRDDTWLNLYGWWSEEQKIPVVIFSVAGFDLAPEGTETDRAIANVMVSGLAGFFGEAEAHERGAKDCPLSFNESRDMKIITGKQTFDARCRGKLLKKLPKGFLASLDSLLQTFSSNGVRDG